MNTMYESRAETRPATPGRARTMVWDAPVRVFHWLMVLTFAGAYLTAESERYRLLHVTLGYTMAGLVAFRLAWGLVGTRHARFHSFVRGPGAVLQYLGSILRGRPKHYSGHNPAGALAIVALLALAAFVTLSGWATYGEVAGHWMEETHEALACAMLAVVAVHVAGVIAGSIVHRENLVGSMLTGRKAAPAGEGIRHAWRSVAILMVAAVLGFWWVQLDGPSRAPGTAPAIARDHEHH